MKKFVAYFALTFLLQEMTISCGLICPCGCDFGSDPPRRINIEGWNSFLAAPNFQILDTAQVHDYDKSFPIIEMASFSFVQLKFTPGLPGVAYACSPAPLEAIQSFQQIQFIARNQFTLDSETDVIQPGADFSSRFWMTHLGTTHLEPIPTFITGLMIYDQDRFEFRLQKKPHAETVIKYDLILTMTDGKVFELKNQILKVR